MESKVNVAAHYDVCNEMFESFLSIEVTYSCHICESTAIEDGGDLESAQLRKLQHAIRAANIQSSDHVLEIGTGWGRFAIEAVRTNCAVTTITLSKDQKATAEQRIAIEGFSSKINVLHCDYRELPIPQVFRIYRNMKILPALVAELEAECCSRPGEGRPYLRY